MTRLGLTAAILLLAATMAIAAGCSETGCQIDSDCQTGRVCAQGVCVNPQWTEGAGGSGGNGGTGGSAPKVTVTSTPSTIEWSTAEAGIIAAYSSGGSAAAATFVLSTFHINDIFVECEASSSTCASRRIIDVDLYDVQTAKWIVGDGNKTGMCSGLVCSYYTSLRYVYVNNSHPLNLLISLEPDVDAGP